MYHPEPTLNIGIEEEYQFIDPESRELLGFVSQSMSREELIVQDRTRMWPSAANWRGHHQGGHARGRQHQ